MEQLNALILQFLTIENEALRRLTPHPKEPEGALPKTQLKLKNCGRME
jgi:hypothetical protein